MRSFATCICVVAPAVAVVDVLEDVRVLVGVEERGGERAAVARQPARPAPRARARGSTPRAPRRACASKSNVGASASRLRRAPAASTKETPARRVTSRSAVASKDTQPPSAVRAVRGERAREARDGEDRVAAAARAGDLRRPGHLPGEVGGDALDRAREGHHDARVGDRRERVALHGGARRRGQLHHGLRQREPVVARLGLLADVRQDGRDGLGAAPSTGKKGRSPPFVTPGPLRCTSENARTTGSSNR